MPSPGKKTADAGGFKGAPHVEILMSTYNGAAFLTEQLESIATQTHANWSLIVRDDGSTDETPRVIEGFRQLHPDKVRIAGNRGERLGASRSFATLLQFSTAPYVMFADQDDVWMEDKIEATLERMRNAEAKHPGVPVLVHSDMEVVDSTLGIIAESFWRHQNLDPEERSLKTLLVHNNVTGCAMMLNRALADAAVPVPSEAIIHDWWAALVAAGLGRIEYIDRPMVRYRQHGENVIGSGGYSAGYHKERLTSFGRTAELLRRTVAQAGAFCAAYGDRLGGADRELARAFSTVLDRPRLIRPWVVLGRGIHARGFLRNLGIVVLLIALGRGGGAEGQRAARKERS